MNGQTTLAPQTSAPREPWVPHPEYRALDEREQYLKAELERVRDRKRAIAVEIFSQQPHEP